MLEMVIDATIRSGTPIFLATTGTILMEKSGVINLGIEGLMLVGALTGFTQLLLLETFTLGFY